MKIVYKYFLDAIKNFKKHFVITFLISFLSAILTISIPIGLKFFLSKDLNTKDIILYIFIFLALIIASIYVSIIKIKTMDNYGGDYFKYILKRIQLTLYNTDYKNIDSLNKKGLSHTLYSDAMNVMSTVGVMIPSIISSLVITLSLLILAFYFNKVLAIFCAVSILIGVFISYFAREKMYSTSKQTNIKLKRIHDYIIEMIEMLMDTRHNKAEDYYLDKTDIIISDFIETAKDEDITRQLYNEIVINYNIIIQVVISILLSLPFINNSVSNAMFFILIFNLLINQGASIEAYVGKIISSAISFKNIDHILSLETPVEKININEIDSISIENLSFSYLDEKIIDGLKAEFKKGQTVLIQGSNGSGKSTLFKILLKYYSYHGSIKFNNTELKNITKETLYNKALYINQKEIILPENIYKYIDEISDFPVNKEDLEVFLKEIDFDYISDEIIDYKKLSGGEIKKVLMAKLYFASKGKDLILIDEIEAGLDEKCLNKLSEIINELAKEKDNIILIITHENNLKIDYTHKYIMDKNELIRV